jgi:hypothetical protein
MMRIVRTVAGLMISAALLLSGGPGLARGLQPTGPPGPAGASGGATATAPWFKFEVDTFLDRGQYASVAFNRKNDDLTYIAYYDAVNGDLWMATAESGSNCSPSGNTWTCFPVSGATANVGRYTSLHLDSSNRYHIAYYDATNRMLMYAVEVSGDGNCGVLGSAQCDEIDSMSGNYHPLGISIAEDAAGYPIIAYQSAYGGLNVARPIAALGLSAGAGNCGPEDLFLTWYCQTIDSPGTWVSYRNGDFVSIAVNSLGLAAIAYYGFITSSAGGNLMVAQQRLAVFLPLVMRWL